MERGIRRTMRKRSSVVDDSVLAQLAALSAREGLAGADVSRRIAALRAALSMARWTGSKPYLCTIQWHPSGCAVVLNVLLGISWWRDEQGVLRLSHVGEA
jgi:hypothetical protein